MGKNQNKKYESAVVAIGVIIYILLQVCVIIFNKMKEPVVFGGLHIPAQSFCGMFSIVQMAVNIIMVVMAGKKGWRAAAVTITINFIWMFFIVGLKQDGTALPSLPILLVNIAVVYILYKGLTKIKDNELALDRMAHSDSLTSLPNRRAFNLAIQKFIEKGEKFAVAFIDIDNFKNINDTMGHDYGNNVLVEISKRWNSILGDKHFLARLGGDEFSLIVSGYSDFEYMKAAIQNSAVDYLLKPVNTEELRRLLQRLEAALLAREQQMASRRDSDAASLAESVRVYLQENYDRQVDLSALAESLAVSAPYLSKLFHEQTGTSPMRYLTDLRMSRARKLLADSSLTVREIAVRVGYPDPFHFSRSFKNAVGVSPAQFREQSRGDDTTKD